MDWEAQVLLKRTTQRSLIPQEWLMKDCPALAPEGNVSGIIHSAGVLSALELQITETDVAELLEHLAIGEWTAESVTTAFCKRAALAHQLTNCLTEVLFGSALTDAKALDEHYAKHKKPVGPLHGLPISLKDNFCVQGVDSSNGFVGWTGQPQKTDTDVVAILRKLGAIIYVKTNVPPGTLSPETFNNCWGRTLNAFNRSLGAGGSSGGEAALIALHGSPVGLGTDDGGSIRIPSAFHGLWSLKPSLGRIPSNGLVVGMAGQEAVPSVVGPMSTSLSALRIFTKSILDTSPWTLDTRGVPLPWREGQLPAGKLCFGVMWDDGVSRPHPPIARALKEMVQALRAAGHEVIDWSNEFHDQVRPLLRSFFTADGGRAIAAAFNTSGEPWTYNMAWYEAASKDPNNDQRTSEMWRRQAVRTQFVKRLFAKWEATAQLSGTGRPIDGLLSPVAVCNGVRHGHFPMMAAGYTSVYNLCDMTAATFPHGHVQAGDTVDTDFVPANEVEADVFAEYTVERYLGMPIGLQLAGRRFEEEKVLEMLEVIKTAMETFSKTKSAS